MNLAEQLGLVGDDFHRPVDAIRTAGDAEQRPRPRPLHLHDFQAAAAAEESPVRQRRARTAVNPIIEGAKQR